MAETILKLSPTEAKILFNTVDGAADAGACRDGNTQQEQDVMESIMQKLQRHSAKWRDTILDPTPQDRLGNHLPSLPAALMPSVM